MRTFRTICQISQPKRHLHRLFTTELSARKLLGLSNPNNPLDLKALRLAYFQAAKQSHPDTTGRSNSDPEAFVQITSAYEFLLANITNNPVDEISAISSDEDQAFREACQAHLGVEAQIVEECKRTPAFRRWLSGRTDAAHYWRNFLVAHGGLAPKLAQVSGVLAAGENASKQPLARRKRRR